MVRNFPPSLPLSETVVYAKNIPSTPSPESPGGISPRSIRGHFTMPTQWKHTCMPPPFPFSYMFANSYIKPLSLLVGPHSTATAIQPNSSCCNSSHVYPLSPVRSRFSSLVYRFPPSGRQATSQLGLWIAMAIAHSPDRGFDIVFSISPYIARTGRPRLVSIHALGPYIRVASIHTFIDETSLSDLATI